MLKPELLYGASYSHVTIPGKVGLRSDIYKCSTGQPDHAETVMELLRPEGCEVLAEYAGIAIPEAEFPVIVRRGSNEEGKSITYYLNYSSRAQMVKAQAPGMELTQMVNIENGQGLTLEPWNLRIVES